MKNLEQYIIEASTNAKKKKSKICQRFTYKGKKRWEYKDFWNNYSRKFPME